jgi:group I intron endonuclease
LDGSKEEYQELRNMTGIYKIVNPIGQIYVGQATSIDRRWRDYSCFKCKSQTKLYRSIGTYGWINHSKEVLEECRADQLDERERYWQIHFNSIREGLNSKYVNGSPEKKERIKKVQGMETANVERIRRDGLQATEDYSPR